MERRVLVPLLPRRKGGVLIMLGRIVPLLEAALKQSAPQGVEYPIQGPVSSQERFCPLARDVSVFVRARGIKDARRLEGAVL